MQTTIKTFINLTISLFDRVENTVGKRENAGNQNFLLFPTVLFKAFLFKVPIAINCRGVCLQNTSKPHSYILKYGDYYDFMDRWIGNGAILQSSSQWQLKEV